MIVNHKYRFVFIHIPKTAGTSIRTALGSLDGCDRDITARTKHETPRKFLRRLEKHRFECLQDIKGYLWVYFTRNPIDRFVSLHRYLIETHRQKYPEVPEEPNAFAQLLAQNSLPEWAKEIRSLKPQSAYLPPAGQQFCGRFETLNQDFERLCTHIDAELALPCLNATQLTSPDLTQEAKLILSRYYRRDFSKFGYSW